MMLALTCVVVNFIMTKLISQMILLCPNGDVGSSNPHETDQQDAVDGTALLCNDCKEEELEAEVQAIEASNVIFGRNLITRSDIYIEPFNAWEVLR